ncbi:hypothetical protein PR003_g5019 [Phytophthora rubi]|uniref:RING-type domain-containing protein n=1 Tax=Phytophthora rubi TaxID=129364 RepID=A0A6A3NE60_9STRA|nr:hypothetical protein PR002_g5009 [Phytophthora rubi]KAE9046046.1 hypothetical protein PR001_g4715 [Phytophthora rubi]KAE9351163.1 hypothetical protein PR003_g5019 [Phytophthora rubi]
MRRPDVVLTPAFAFSSAAQPSVRPSAPPPATGSASGLWSLPPLNQFMTLPGRFLASRFGASVDSSAATSPSSNSSSRAQPAVRRSGRDRGALDNLLNDSDEDWAPTRDHFVLPHMVHFQDVYEPSGGGSGSGSTSTQQHPEQIDLTVSSSEDEGDEHNGQGTAAAEDSDDVIEILGVSESSAPPQPAPMRRKRRRPALGDVIVPKRQCLTDITHSAESTSVSMHNNEQLEKFKDALKCSICLDVMEDITSTTCGHIFCGACIHQAIRASGKCPLCQRRLYPMDTHRLFF